MVSQTRALTLFPTYALSKLLRTRGRKWSRLVSRIAQLPEKHPEHMAYTLMIRRLAHLVGTGGTVCTEPTCATCALEVLNQYGGSERDLLAEYEHTLSEVRVYLNGLQQAVARVA